MGVLGEEVGGLLYQRLGRNIIIIVIITTATITTTPGGKGMVLLSPAKAVLQIFFLLYETNHCEYHGMLVFLKLNE